MQVVLQRSEREELDRKGRTKGIRFELQYRLEVSEREPAAIEKYGLGPHYVLGSPSDRFAFTVQNLLDGGSFTEGWASTVLSYEKLVLKASASAAALLSQIAAFDGSRRVVELTGSDPLDDGTE